MTTDPYAVHYARTSSLLDHLTSLLDVWEVLGYYDQSRILDFTLPGMNKPADCWGELTEPLTQLRDLDIGTAVDTVREAGARGAVDPMAAYDTVRGNLEADVMDTIRRYRGLRPVRVLGRTA